MATVIHLDTHVVAWLYAGENALLSDTARGLIRDHDLRISPMVRLELQYLYEIGKTTVPAGRVMIALADTLGLEISSLPFAAIIEKAENQSWTRDPFDRLIVAQALLEEAALITKDQTIRQHYAKAAW